MRTVFAKASATLFNLVQTTKPSARAPGQAEVGQLLGSQLSLNGTLRVIGLQVRQNAQQLGAAESLNADNAKVVN